MILYLVLTILVLVYFFLPIAEQPIDYDEKDDTIRIYREEVAHIERQHRRQLIDDTTKNQLLTELDRKSALAMMAIDKKTYAYRRAIAPLLVILVGIGLSIMLYRHFYHQEGVRDWQQAGVEQRDDIVEGLFDDTVVERFMLDNGEESKRENYCFLMQHRMLSTYPDNPDALAHVAQCFMSTGFVPLAEMAVDKALRIQPEHALANYLSTEVEFARNVRLSAKSVTKLEDIARTDSARQHKAIYLLAVNNLAQGKSAQAYVEQLKALNLEDDAIRRALAELEREVTAHPHTAVSTSNEGNSENKEAKDNSSAVSFSARVEIAPELANDPAIELANSTLFVIVKGQNGQLLTATRQILKDNKTTIEVTVADDQADAMQIQPMAGQAKISVVARISKTSEIIASSGDLTSSSVDIALPQSGSATLVIDQRVP